MVDENMPEEDWDFSHSQFIMFIWLFFTVMITYQQRGGGLLLSIGGLILAIRFIYKENEYNG